MPYRRFSMEEEPGNGQEAARAPQGERINPKLMYITQSYYDHDWPSIMHTHYFTELFYVLGGEGGLFTIEENTFPVAEGDLVIINPNVSHTEHCSGNNRLEYIVLGINGLRFFDKDNRPCTYSRHNFGHDKKEISFILQMLIREISQKEEGYQGICQNLLEVLLLYLQRKTDTIPTSDASRKTSRECRFIEEYIDEHFTENISLETLSALTFMNKFYLVHAFKNYKGVSPINYLIDKRIQESKLLLETTNFSIAKIAQQVGFSSQSYFSQTFRRRTGMTPVQYKKQHEAARS